MTSLIKSHLELTIFLYWYNHTRGYYSNAWVGSLLAAILRMICIMPYLAKTIGKYQNFAQFIRIETFACPVDNTHLAARLINVTALMTLASCTLCGISTEKQYQTCSRDSQYNAITQNFRLLSMAHKFSATFFQKRPNSVPQSLGGLLFHNCRGSSLFLKE